MTTESVSPGRPVHDLRASAKRATPGVTCLSVVPAVLPIFDGVEIHLSLS